MEFKVQENAVFIHEFPKKILPTVAPTPGLMLESNLWMFLPSGPSNE